MYPNRAEFRRMVEEEAGLSAAGRQTLLALYDGPLHLRQILDLVNDPQDGGEPAAAKEKTITESALRKRLDVLIAGGILARAGSERTNPYYYIRRPWIFNQYILIKCRERPAGGLLDLTVLLHELAQISGGGESALPHPRYISAVGERTERSHQIGAAYAAFQKLLGNRTAIGDYLEGIYEDIYEGKVPASDIDALVARDFLRFVATAPDEEREVRFFLWYADFFHTLDRYQEAKEAFERGIALAGEMKLDLFPILAGTRISKGHILHHLNDFTGAKEAFLERVRDRSPGPFVRAASLFGAGEVELITGDPAPARFVQALELCGEADPAGTDADVLELRADILRRTGAVHRMQGRFSEAEACYAQAGEIYGSAMPRGHVMLLPERGELLRARAFAAPEDEAARLLAEADRIYDEAKAAAQRVRNINWYANGLIGECEVARIAFLRCKTPLPKNLATNFANAFEIYCQISSRWGIVQAFLAEALLYHAAADELASRYAATADKLGQAERFAAELGLKRELALIRRIKAGNGREPELNPLTFL